MTITGKSNKSSRDGSKTCERTVFVIIIVHKMRSDGVGSTITDALMSQHHLFCMIT